jgi:hypothetical protein
MYYCSYNNRRNAAIVNWKELLCTVVVKENVAPQHVIYSKDYCSYVVLPLECLHYLHSASVEAHFCLN